MNKLIEKINKIPKTYFSLNDLSKISELNRNSLRVSVSRAIKSGQITKLTKSFYAKNIEDINWKNLAVNLYTPSYISFETALNYYNILSQQTIGITLATNKRKNEINISDHIIIYHHIRADLFWGYKNKNNFLIADAEKAFLDLAYLSLNGYAHFDPEEMNLELLNKDKIKKYLKKFNNERLKKLISKII